MVQLIKVTKVLKLDKVLRSGKEPVTNCLLLQNKRRWPMYSRCPKVLQCDEVARGSTYQSSQISKVLHVVNHSNWPRLSNCPGFSNCQKCSNLPKYSMIKVDTSNKRTKKLKVDKRIKETRWGLAVPSSAKLGLASH